MTDILPIAFPHLSESDVKRLQGWLVKPEGLLLEKVLTGMAGQAMVEAAENLVGSLTDSAIEHKYAQSAADAKTALDFIRLLRAMARGYVGESDSEQPFPYITITCK